MLKTKYIFTILLTLFSLTIAAQSPKQIGDAFAETFRVHSYVRTDSLIKVLEHKYRKKPEVLTELGRAYYQNGVMDRAYAFLNKAIEVNPKCAAPYMQYGDMFKQTYEKYWGDTLSCDSARYYYRKAISAEPKNMTPYLKLLILDNTIMDIYENKYHGTDINVKRALTDSTVAVLSEIKENFPDYAAEQKIGDLYYNTGTWDKVIESYAKVEDKLLPYQYNYYALAYYFKGDPDKGLEIADKAMKMSPGYAQFNRTRLYCLYDKKEYAKAIKAYERLTSLTDSVISLDYFTAGRAYLRTDNVKDATLTFNKIWDTNNTMTNANLQAIPKEIKQYAEGKKADGDYDGCANVYYVYYQNMHKQDAYYLYTCAHTYLEKAEDELLGDEDKMKANLQADEELAKIQEKYPDYNPIIITYYRGIVNNRRDEKENYANGYARPYYERLITLISQDTSEKDYSSMLKASYRYLAYYHYLQHDMRRARYYALEFKKNFPSETALDQLIKATR